jgi:hypothetical protein
MWVGGGGGTPADIPPIYGRILDLGGMRRDSFLFPHLSQIAGRGEKTPHQNLTKVTSQHQR